MKSGLTLECPNCGKTFYIIKSRIKKSDKHYCSLKCLSQFTAEQRSKKLRKKEYPFVFGPCKYCGKDIIIRSSQFDKPDRKFCSNSCATSWRNERKIWTEAEKTIIGDKARIRFKGTKYTQERREKLSKSISGNAHWNWKGGITANVFKERSNFYLKNWRLKVFQRDKFTCQICGAKSKKNNPVKLNAHHIKRWSSNLDLRYDINNGVTLCENCHKKTDNYKGKGTFDIGGIKIIQYSLNGEFIKEWPSIASAARKLGLGNTAIANNLKGYSKTSGGFKWSYKK